MSFFIIFPFIAFLINCFIWVYIFAQKQKSSLNTACLILLGSFTLWTLFDVIIQSGLPEIFLLPIIKIKSIFFIYIGYLFLHFIYIIFKLKKDIFYKIVFVICHLSILISLSTNLIIKGYDITSFGIREAPGILFAYILFLSIAIPGIYCSIYIFINLIQYYLFFLV